MSIGMDQQVKIAEWRRKCAAGTATIEELREAMAYLRANRKAAAVASTTKKASAAKPNGDALLAELDGLGA